MSEEKQRGKWITSIVIGGALGSLMTWVFSSKRRRDKVSERAKEYIASTKGNLEKVLEKKKSFFRRFF